MDSVRQSVLICSGKGEREREKNELFLWLAFFRAGVKKRGGKSRRGFFAAIAETYGLEETSFMQLGGSYNTAGVMRALVIYIYSLLL